MFSSEEFILTKQALLVATKQLAEYKQRAEAAEAKLRELALDELAAQAQELDMGYAKPFPAPKQEEK